MKISSLGFLVAAHLVSHGAWAETTNVKAPEWPVPGAAPIAEDNLNDAHPFVAGSSVLAYKGIKTKENFGVVQSITAYTLKCGWDIGTDGHAKLGQYHQLSELDIQTGIQKQTNFIDGNILVVESVDLSQGPTNMIVNTEVLPAKGQIVAKQCVLNSQTNTYSNCKIRSEFRAASDIRAQNTDVQNDCVRFFNTPYGVISMKQLIDTPDYKSPEYKDPIWEKKFYSAIRTQFEQLSN